MFRQCLLSAMALLTAVAMPVSAQEQRLVEEVVARVNADVITRSQYLQTLDETMRDFQRSYPADEAAQRYEAFRPRILDLMIDNVLLFQKGQELGIDVEAQVNVQFKRIAEQQGMTLTELEDAMRRSGTDPNEARARLRERLLRESVLSQEVYGALWRALTEREKLEYYEKHKDKFEQPGEIKLSEIFLSVEGRSFGEIEARARELIEASRNGAQFKDLVRKYGDPNRGSYTNGGSLGSFKSADELAAPLAEVAAKLQEGQFSEPIRMADGVLVLRMDERREASPRPFADVKKDVEMSLVYEKGKEAEARYLERLRADAYIRITPGYESTPSTATAEAGSN
jgi:parvulin-like peptidyl-prolyl isomerase